MQRFKRALVDWCVSPFFSLMTLNRTEFSSASQGVLPHGIDVLRKIDFFTVSIRKKAFLEAAPLVAEYVLPCIII